MEGQPPVFRFDAFELDPRSGELLRSGRRRRLTPQAFRLLALLVERPGVVVTRDEIRQALWPEGLFVDVDSAVNACISQIRAALGDKPVSPRYVETLPRRGYRFVAPVQRIEIDRVPDGAEPADAPGIPAPVQAPPRNARTFGATLGVALAAIVTVALVVAASVPKRSAAPDYVRHYGIDALQKYERARTGLEDSSPRELKDRVAFFNEAIGLAPDFAEAYAGVADASLILAAYRAETPSLAYAAAKAAAAKALALDPTLGDAHAAYATAVLLLDWNWKDAQSHFARALSHASRSPRVHHWYARYLTALGRHAEARTHAQRAAELTPTSPSAVTYLGVADFYAGDSTAARRHCQRAADLMPEFTPAHNCLKSLDTPNGVGIAMPDAYLQPAIEAVSEGDISRALERLQASANRHSDSLVYASVQPGLRALQSEPRFQMILERVGLRPAANDGR